MKLRHRPNTLEPKLNLQKHTNPHQTDQPEPGAVDPEVLALAELIAEAALREPKRLRLRNRRGTR